MSGKIFNRLIIGILFLIILGFGSCNVPVSQIGRMQQFQDDLNNDRDSVYLNLHPSMSNYNAWKSATTWSGTGFDYSPQSFSGMTVNDNTVTGTWTRTTLGPHLFKCQMLENGTEGWFIIKFEVDNDDDGSFETTLLP